MLSTFNIFRSVGVESFDLQYRWLLAIAWLGRPKAVARIRQCQKLHLGCGPHVLPGWANLDLAGAPGSVRWHLNWRLPVDDASVDLIFSEHFIEHIDKAQATMLLRDCHRALRVGGVLRLSTPSLAKLVTEYQAGRLDEWADVAWTPASPCDLLNDGMRAWGHRYLYDEAELRLQLQAAGFNTVLRMQWRQSAVAGLGGLEQRPFHDELIMEATK